MDEKQFPSSELENKKPDELLATDLWFTAKSGGMMPPD
jgi:hypothetical protein